MAAKKKPWNAAIPPEELFPALHGGKHVPPPALPDKVLPGHSTPPMPKKETAQPAPRAPEKK